jgi:acetoin utilization protein AcuC
MVLRVYYGDELARYGFGHGHPFGPDRLDAFWAEVLRRGLDSLVEIAPPVSCSEADLARFHTADYIGRVKAQSLSGQGYLDYGDTPAFKGVFEAACFVVGSVLDGARHALAAPGRRVFVPIAGLHHARRDSAAGFCVFNDVGVLIETLRAVHGIRRIAYVDIDAHHGDGVFYAFEDDPDLMVADFHEDGHFLYPGTGFAEETGRNAATGTKLNVPMRPDSGDDEFMKAWPRVEDMLRAARPEIVLLQAGADSIAGDPITHLRYTPAVHAHVAGRLAALADELCDGRLIAMGGGGYNRASLAQAWCAVVEALAA